MDRFEAMRTLLAAVDGGSLSAASRSLNTPLPNISRRVSDLEAHLGAQLLVRTSRRLILTDAGEAFVAAARRLLEDLADAERAASGEYRVPRGELIVTAPIMFGKLHVAPIVHAFLGAYPDVTVRLVLSDATIDLVEAHVDVALRVGQLPDSDLVARKLGEIRWVICASPAYLDRRGAIETPADLARHDCIAFEGNHSSRTWQIGAGPAAQRVEIVPRFSVNTADAIIDAAAAGIGVARIMSYQAAPAVNDGRLVPLFTGLGCEPVPIHIVHRRQRSQPLKLRAFLDFVAPRLQQVLGGVAGCFD